VPLAVILKVVGFILHISSVAKISKWIGIWRRSRDSAPQPPDARGLGAEHPELGDFCNFSIKITHFYAYFCQDSYFKAITHQLKRLKQGCGSSRTFFASTSGSS